ncbi:MAG: hypothetical protein EOP91_03340 [Lysobacteraceae bacterium]|nr:MAG: hypothetical protein EOP91_03340 [Xanthomonadaceae bacterium]
MRFHTLALRSCLVWAAAASVIGCASVDLSDPDWEQLARNPPVFPAIAELSEKGFRSCTKMLSAATLSAVGDSVTRMQSGHAPVSTDLRPATLTAITRKGQDTEHADIVAGLDGSGRCFARWNVSRVWRTSCRQLQARSPWISQYTKQDEFLGNTSVHGMKGSGISIFLTSTGARRCLMTATETVYWEGTGTDFEPEDDQATGSEPTRS